MPYRPQDALARQVSADLSFPDARIVVVAHPIGGEPDEVLHRRAEATIIHDRLQYLGHD